MFKVFVGIIILAIVIYGGILIYQQYLLRQLKTIDQERQGLDIDSLEAAVAQVKTMSLTGKTLDQVEALLSDYTALNETRLPRLKAQLDQATGAAKQYRLLATHSNVKKAQSSLKVTQDAIAKLTEQIDALKKVDEDHKAAVKALEKKYQDLRKTLLAKNFMYGPSIDGLETQLGTLEDDNDRFRELTSQGDHEKAAELLAQLQTDTEHLEEMIQQIPPLYKNLETEFPAQITELQQGEATLSAQGFKYPETDMHDQIQGLNGEVKAGKEALTQLDMDKVQANDTALTNKIDHFYDTMEKEMGAKEKVTENLDTLAKFISHARNQNTLLTRELDRLSLNYTLDHQEVETAREFKEQIRNIDSAYQADIEAIQSNEAVYTQVLARQTQAEHDLQQIEEQQQTINTTVSGLVKEEQQARDTLQQFELRQHGLRRQVENLNLPGVSKTYLDYYNVVRDEIAKLNDDINQVQINMEEITKQLIMIESDLDILAEKTTDLVDSAELSEQLLQYANRYRLTHDEVAKASQEAQRLFDQEFDYAKSLETIATVLDQVEPGSYKRLEDNYYKRKGTAKKPEPEEDAE
ncbi:septation ring formation regulator EzrA [Secundilactobacillus paracollinoides]|uniref:Septation ring formation regulator EzrA n=1 Tax=Secundilactobacillus paracollinoides TaxID=240427 RepID=A0A1B2IZV0_9LACO|nr:septation ring formation regulator EzrA [Secundilactobacillus paracollinoides]ANZ61706.1 septation ring formation regulator EzrA [Secundilactobacillus paracollinoides]ANZ63341.1 septation ring formation regulator EzrA [Secundilactobacillus paracollinoides]ANZ67624.1 septation ring formation regulator EzrA [Secundilactobacillus paracollinoides]